MSNDLVLNAVIHHPYSCSSGLTAESDPLGALVTVRPIEVQLGGLCHSNRHIMVKQASETAEVCRPCSPVATSLIEGCRLVLVTTLSQCKLFMHPPAYQFEDYFLLFLQFLVQFALTHSSLNSRGCLSQRLEPKSISTIICSL